MMFSEHRYLLITYILGFLVFNAYARSWDLAVVIGREIDFFARNRTLTGQAKIAEAVALTGIAYDDITRTMYLTDTRNNISIFSNDLTDKNFTSKPLLKKENGTHILGIVFDTPSRTLFWCDALKEAIMRMELPINRPPEEPIVLHDLTNRSPRGISLDVCNSHVYWVNSNKSNPTIERSNLDGSDRVTVIKENLYEPLAVSIDHYERKIYWIDDVEGIRFKIERSNLDGSQRELLVHRKHQQPVYLAVDHYAIYWSDLVHSAIWTMPKNATPGVVPTIFNSYYESNRDADPAGIITRDNVGKIDCAAIAVKMEKNKILANPATVQVHIETYNNLITSTEESESTTESSRYCLNDGHFDKKDGACRCKAGFSGTHCETSLCHNYCLRGSCNINSQGLPECKCESAFVGERCEREICDGYCRHDGQCSVQNGKPTCKCKYSVGPRCENLNDVAEICAIFCANNNPESDSFNANPCRCAEMSEMAQKMITVNENVEYRTLLPIFAGLIGVLVLLIAVLSYYVNKLRRRPRIKKRFVVSKGVTPLTSRPQIPDNQCEITIENCCNMNICETPCFEPKLRTAVPRSDSSKKEEKNSLLDNMEGNSC